MALTLSLKALKCPDGVGRDQRDVARAPFSIGRGIENDWVLSDPEKVLSKRHCIISAKGESWLVTDVSANGTFLNDSPLDPELPHPLRDRDRLSLGQYELEVRVAEGFDEDEDASEAPTRFGTNWDKADRSRLTSDPFPPAEGHEGDAPHPAIGLPHDFDALSNDGRLDAHPYAERDDTPDMASNFQPPRPSLELIPEGWEEDDMGAPKRALEPAPAPAAADSSELPSLLKEEAAAPPAIAESRPAPQAEAETTERRVRPSPVPAWPDIDGGRDAEGFVAFAAGADYRGPSPDDADRALRSLGAAFRAMVSGLRRSMIARATVKTEFRIDQTMIRAAGNNPIKFAADDDDAIAALVGVHRRSSVSAEDAVTEAMRDIALHELAVSAAMQSAVRELLAELTPDKIMRGVRRTKLDDLIGTRKQGAWDAFVERHGDITRALADEFDSVFGRSFARAYETALKDLDAALDRGDRS